MTELAPIILFIYNRPWHTLQTLQALQANDLADQSKLFIYADGPKENASEKDLEKISDVLKIAKSKSWCKEVFIVERERNYGLAENIIDGVSSIVNEYGKVIVLEDDIVTSNGFLRYMNEALEIHKDEKQVFGISGYKYPSKPIESPTYFLPIGCSWGWGTWNRAWQQVSFNTEHLFNEITKNNLKKKFDFGGHPFFKMLLAQKNKEIDSWAIRYYASFFLQGGVFLFPNQSLTENLGFDNSGTHCKNEEHFSLVKGNTDNIVVSKTKVELNSTIIKKIQEGFYNSSTERKENKFHPSRFLKKSFRIIKKVAKWG